jgi:hypothetical protein
MQILEPNTVAETHYSREAHIGKGEQRYEEIHGPTRCTLLRRLYTKVLGMTRNGPTDRGPERIALGASHELGQNLSHIFSPSRAHM